MIYQLYCPSGAFDQTGNEGVMCPDFAVIAGLDGERLPNGPSTVASDR